MNAEQTSTTPVRIAWFSPLPSDENASSISVHVTQTLLPLISNQIFRDVQFEIELFHDGFWSYQEYPTFHYLSALERHRKRPYDIFFYQIEDGSSQYHFCRSHLGLMPGVAYFHDYYLKDEGPEPFHYSPWQKILEKYQNPELPWPKRRDFPDRPAAFGARELGLSAVPIFSSERTLTEFQRSSQPALSKFIPAKGPRAFFMPHPIDGSIANTPVQKKDRTSPSRVAFLGSPFFETRIHKLLEALRELPGIQLQWLLNKNEISSARQIVSEFSNVSVEFFTARNPQRWAEIVAGADAAVHTLYSAFGDPHPYLAISLAHGAPSLVSNFSVPEFLPPQLLFKIQLGYGEHLEIREILSKLCAAPTKSANAFDRYVYAELAKTYAREQHDSKIVACELADIFLMTLGRQRETIATWSELQRQGREELLSTQLQRLESQNVDARKAIKEFYQEVLNS